MNNKTRRFWLISDIVLIFLTWFFIGLPALTPASARRLYAEWGEYKILKSVKHDGIYFDSHSSDPRLSSFEQFIENEKSKYKTVDIRFRMKVHSISAWDNVFQTAEGNDGMRMELGSPSTLGLLAGYTTGIRRDGCERAYVLLTHLKLNEWYSVHIRASSHHSISIQLKEGLGTQEGERSIEGPLGDFDISDIAVGTGFSKTRPFNGSIRDFTIEYQLLRRVLSISAIMSLLNTPLTVFLFIAAIILATPLIRQHIPNWNFSIKAVRLHRLSREDKIRCATFILITGFIAGVFYHYARGMYRGEGWPLNTFLTIPADYAGDLYRGFVLWSQSQFRVVNISASYFPSAYLIIDFLTRLKRFDLALAASMGSFCTFLVAYVYRNVRTDNQIESLQNTIICSFTSYPFLFICQTANIEMFVFIFLALFIYFYQRKQFMLSTLCLAMPISMKLFPAVFLVLYVSDRRYRDVLYTLLWAFILSLIPLLIFDGGIRSGFTAYLGRLIASQHMYSDLMIMRTDGIHYGHSLLGAIRIFAGDSFPPMESVLLPYGLIALDLFGALALYVIIIEQELWKKVALLVIAMNVLPYTSTDYKLMHLFIPLFLFINTKTRDALDVWYVVLFSLLLIPKDYCYFQNWPLYSLNTVLNPFLMLIIALLIMSSQFKSIHYHLTNTLGKAS